MEAPYGQHLVNLFHVEPTHSPSEYIQDGTSDVGEYNPAVHGTSGPVQITTSNYHYNTAKRIIGAAGQVSGFEFNEETNDENMLGLSWAQSKPSDTEG